MDPLTLALGITSAIRVLATEIERIRAAGNMTAEEQARLDQELDDIRSGRAFTKPHYNQPPA